MNEQPLTEEEVNLTISWTADARTTAALKRQAAYMGFASVEEYLIQAIACTLSSNESEWPGEP